MSGRGREKGRSKNQKIDRGRDKGKKKKAVAENRGTAKKTK